MSSTPHLRIAASGVVTGEVEAWNRFVAAHGRGNLLQTSQWGSLKQNFGWDWELVTLDNGDSPIAGAIVLYRKLPLGLGTIAYVPRGPVVDWDNVAQTKALLATLHRAARRRQAWACWIEPEVLDGGSVASLLKGVGYSLANHTIQPRSTIVVDLSPSEDEILAAMKSKTRYNIRLAERKSVTVREGTIADVEVFYTLMQETGERDAFGIHSLDYYRRAMELYSPVGQVALFLAELDSEPLAGLMVFAVGTRSWYICGASSDQHRNLMPAYAVQWAAMRWAKARGCITYDLWGIPDADEETLEEQFAERSDGLWGVYRFKRGFGGQVVRYAGLWERSLNPLYPLRVGASYPYRLRTSCHLPSRD
ncbi:MAG: peptidoglycan bridge formation glycyltransferase FemA/FemB family protein [Anaerolineae bacterium]|nr:peptidoglycan bridge formation glycyltransferase FemA/FemB family protein [Anaerolineae bacterium]